MRYASLLLAGVALSAASCVFHKGDTCSDDDCATNQSPIAKIRGVTADGDLRVGAKTAVLISAADSHDPDDDPLTYHWSVSSDCDANVTGATDEVELRLAGLEVGDGCNVTLTVDDGFRDATAQANLVVRDIGAFVSARQPCVSAYDVTSAEAQGTRLAPFCAMRDALLAAADYQLAELSLDDDGAHVVDAVLQIDKSVDIRGGYARESDWQPAGTRSAIELSGAPGIGPDPTLAVMGASPNDTVRFDSVTVSRRAACVTECALIDVTATGLVISNASLGKSDENPGTEVRVAAAAGVYYSVRASGGSNGRVRGGLSVDNVDITGASAGFGSVGVSVRDGLPAQLTNVTINEAARTVVGVQLLRAGDVRVERSSINVASNAVSDADSRATNSTAFGIVDGNYGSLVIGSCSASDTETCGSSEKLAIAGSSIAASKARLAVGVAAFGTRRLMLEPSGIIQPRITISANARQALGIWTMATGRKESDADGFIADDIMVETFSASSPGAPDAVSWGWADGYERDGVDGTDPTKTVIGLGSISPQLTNSSITARVISNGVVDVAGIALRGSVGPMLSGMNVAVGAAGSFIPAEGFVVTRAAGVRLLRTSDVSVSDTAIAVTSVTATWTVADFIDGQMSLASDELAHDADGADYGSLSIRIDATSLSGALAVTRLAPVTGINPLRACVAFFGTQGVDMSGSTVGCQLGTSSISENSPTMAGVVTVATRDTSIVGSSVLLSAAAPTTAVRLIGIQDGSRRNAALGSSSLRIARNIIDLDAASTLSVGVRLSGIYSGRTSGTERATLVDDNVIRIAKSAANIGALVFSTNSALVLNTVRVATCTASNCLQAFATGFYLMNIVAAAPVQVIGNAFDVADVSFGGGDPTATPLVTEQDPLAGSLGVSSVVDNVHGTSSSTQSLLVQILSNDFDDVSTPVHHTVFDEDALVTAGARAVGNVDGVPLYCGDGVHGALGGPQEARVTHTSPSDFPAAVLTDIDGQDRRLPGTDAGADVLGFCVL